MVKRKSADLQKDQKVAKVNPTNCLEACSAVLVILSFLQLRCIAYLSRCNQICRKMCHNRLIEERFWNQNNIKKLTIEEYQHVKKMKVNRACSKWPPYLTHVRIQDRKSLRRIQLPNSIRYLAFDNLFQQLKTELLCLVNLTSIEFDNNRCFKCGFNQSIKDLFPESVTYLNLGTYFDQAISFAGKSLLPSQLQTLRFGLNSTLNWSVFNQSIDVLPSCLTDLELSSQFRQPIYSLPPNLKTIHLGWAFHFPLTCLPLPLQTLHLSVQFNTNLLLPPNLTHLSYGDEYNKKIASPFPDSLKFIQFGMDYNQKIEVPFPPKLTSLQFGYDFNQRFRYSFPSSLEVLVFGCDFNKPIRLPPLLKVLIFGKDFNQLLDDLPKTLQHLEFGDRFNQRLLLPAGLRYLCVGKCFHRKLELPPNLTTFICGTNKLQVGNTTYFL